MRRVWIVVAAGLLAGGSAYGWASSQPPVYVAQVRLLSGPVNTDYGTLRASGELARTYAELARSRGVLDAAIAASGVGGEARDLAPDVHTSANTVTRLVSIRVRHNDPQVAVNLADAIGAELINLSARPTSPDLAIVEELLAQPSLEALGDNTRELVRQAASAVLDSPLAGRLGLVEPAELPSSPVAPRVTLVTVMGLLAGAVAACVVLLALEPAVTPSVPTAQIERRYRFTELYARRRDGFDDGVGA